MNQQTDEMRLYFARVRPLCGEIYATGLVITGDYQRADYVLRETVLRGWQSHRHFRSSRGFSTRLREEARRVALSGVKGPGETPIEVFSAPSVEENPDSLMKLIRTETPLVRRLILLKFGCELHSKALARVCGVSVRQAEGQLNRFFRRLKRRLPQGERNHLDARLKALCREELQSLGAPDLGALYRAFEAEAAGSDRPMGRMALRAASWVAAALLLLLLAGILWGVAAIVQPARTQDGGVLTTQQDGESPAP